MSILLSLYENECVLWEVGGGLWKWRSFLTSETNKENGTILILPLITLFLTSNLITSVIVLECNCMNVINH